MRARAWMCLALVGLAPAWAKEAPDAGTKPRTGPVQKMDPAQFKVALEKARASGKFTLLDVREPSETAGGYVHGADRMPYNSGVFARGHAGIPKDRPVLIYCASGQRARRAAEILANEGWTDILVLSDGGYEDLR